MILGGSGAIGRAVARRLLASAWEVVITGRREHGTPGFLEKAGASYMESNRKDADDLKGVVGKGADLLVDCPATPLTMLEYFVRSLTMSVRPSCCRA